MPLEDADLHDLGFPPLEAVREPTPFFQAFLNRIDVTSLEGGGVEIRVCIEPGTPILTSSGRRRLLDDRVDRDEGARVSEIIHAMRGQPGERRELRFERFRLRHASAGVLASLRDSRRTRRLLFLRDIHPVGWNIANGGSETLDELARVDRLLVREATEEILAWDPAADHLLGLEAIDGEAAKARRAWRERLSIREERVMTEHWTEGPDSLRVVLPDATVVQTTGLYLSVNVADFALECSRLLTLDAPEGAIPLDGELLEGRLLDRPAGLFGDAARQPEATFRGGEPFALAPDAPPPMCPVTEDLLGRL